MDSRNGHNIDVHKSGCYKFKAFSDSRHGKVGSLAALFAKQKAQQQAAALLAGAAAEAAL